MKAIILLAGKGRRLGHTVHKALTELHGRPSLHYLLDNFVKNGITEFIPVVGHNAEKVLKCMNAFGNITVTPVYNNKYETTNNLVSLWKARHLVKGEDFILCNGDMVFDPLILEKFLNHRERQTSVAIEKTTEIKDSPGVELYGTRVFRLNRHMIKKRKHMGYAIGLYKFGAATFDPFFAHAKSCLKRDINSGFHDPFCQQLLLKHEVYYTDIGKLAWMDIDSEEDVPQAQEMIQSLKKINRSTNNVGKQKVGIRDAKQ